MLSPSLTTVRVFIHVLAASVWVGGQIVMAGLLPTARSLSSDAPRALAGAFGRVAWPAYGVAFATGIWNLLEVSDASLAYHMTLGAKLVLLVVAGGAAAWHAQTSIKLIKAITGAAGGILAVAVAFLGVLLTTGS